MYIAHSDTNYNIIITNRQIIVTDFTFNIIILLLLNPIINKNKQLYIIIILLFLLI